MPLDTLSEEIERLQAAGYLVDFRPENERLRAVGTACVHPPEDFVIDDIARFEGETNPDDEAILFALRCDAHGVRGTYAVAYGPALDATNGEMVRRLGRASAHR